VCVVYAELVFLALPLLIPRLRIPVSYYLFALGSVVVPLLSPSRDWYFLSISRFALVLFPLFFIAAKTFRSRWLFLTVAGASVAGLLFCLANFSKGYFVA
ncbi:MAG: hypothetical protein IRY98_08600, partial [Alicyclobacillaceae bacterium]|nr:hypothetical protein [Alicyclobacillaceae bacterium]